MPRKRSKEHTRDKDATTVELKRIRDNELAVKRMAGHISCAECCRLKIRCDKKIPCNSCMRRGCRAICPLNTNANPDAHTGPPPPQLSTKKLHDRIAALEDALHIATNGDHPLLRQDFTEVKSESTPELLDADSYSTDSAENEISDAFGTLSLGSRKAFFLGSSAVEHTLISNLIESEVDQNVAQDIDKADLSSNHVQANAVFPFSPAETLGLSKAFDVTFYLPPFKEALELVGSFVGYDGWVSLPIDRTQIFDGLLPMFYPDGERISPHLVKEDVLDDLALLFAIFAVGCDVNSFILGAPSDLCEHYKGCSRAALATRGLMEEGTLSVVQTLVILGTFEMYSWRPNAPERAWKLKAIALFVASSIGLHRDPVRWNLDSVHIERRRKTFWELNASDKWKSLGTGRPALFASHVIDCEFPTDMYKITDADGEVYEGTRNWQYRFARDVLPKLADKICSARPIKYSEILELDRLIRGFEMHPCSKQLLNSSTFPRDIRRLYMLKCILWRELATQVVHRNFFARVILESPEDPQKSPYAPSFLASYRSAVCILKVLRAISVAVPGALERIHSFWSASLASAVIVGSVAARVNTFSFAKPALDELEAIIPVFEMSQAHPIPRNSLKILYKFRDKARASRSAAMPAPVGHCSTNDATRRVIDGNDDDDELMILKGNFRLPDHNRESTPSTTLTMISSTSTNSNENETQASSSKYNRLAKSGFFHVEELNSQSVFIQGNDTSDKQSTTDTVSDAFTTPFSTDFSLNPSAIAESGTAPSASQCLPSMEPSPSLSNPFINAGESTGDMDALLNSFPFIAPSAPGTQFSVFDINSSSIDPNTDPSAIDLNSFMDVDGSLSGQTARAWQTFVDESGLASEEGMQSFNGFNTWEDMGFILQ